MNLSFLNEMIRLGLGNLLRHKLRSVLTALGIIFGIAAVITMVSIGKGKERDALERIERMGAKNIIIRSQKPPESQQAGGGQQRGRSIRYGITRADAEVLSQSFPGAEAIVPLKEVGGQVLRGSRRQTSQAHGVTPDLLDAARIRVARGRYITADDLEQRAMVAVVGAEVAKEMFPLEDPLGQTLRIDDKTLRVVGILAPLGLAGGAGGAQVGRDLNLDVHIPITTAALAFGDRVVRRTSGNFSSSEVQISELYIVAPTRDDVAAYAETARRIMEVRHPGMTDVGVIVPYELLAEAKREALTWQAVLGAIAGISLLVGGIGIMNIMLANVTERTREIGIRRALGATRRAITLQFLIETSVLSVLGGLLGVALGISGSLAIGAVAKLNMPTYLTTWSIALSFAVAALTGVVFGLYPAIMASRKDPIVALRHD